MLQQRTWGVAYDDAMLLCSLCIDGIVANALLGDSNETLSRANALSCDGQDTRHQAIGVLWPFVPAWLIQDDDCAEQLPSSRIASRVERIRRINGKGKRELEPVLCPALEKVGGRSVDRCWHLGERR